MNSAIVALKSDIVTFLDVKSIQASIQIEWKKLPDVTAIKNSKNKS